MPTTAAAATAAPPLETSRLRASIVPVLLLALIFGVNLAQTALETSTTYDWSLELGSAMHWLEGGPVFQNHDVTNAITIYGYSLAYFFLFPLLAAATAWALARQDGGHAFTHFAVSLALDYALSLPFFLWFPVPERWAYPDASAIVLSDLWSSQLIESFRPMSALDNCFPSFHTSMTVVIVLCCYVNRVAFRTATVPLGLMVLVATYALGVHWVGDVVAGIAVGVISVAIASRLVGSGEATPAARAALVPR